MKSDPLQGILFRTKPVHLHQRAVKRATINDVVVAKPQVFYSKLQTLKTGTQRLTRRSKTPQPRQLFVYEYSPRDQKRPNKK